MSFDQVRAVHLIVKVGWGEGPTSFYIIVNQFHGAILSWRESIVRSHGCMQIRQLYFKWSPNDVLRYHVLTLKII